MAIIDLREYKTARGIVLPPKHVRQLRTVLPTLTIVPSLTAGAYDLTPGSQVGSIQLDDTLIRIQPKVAVDRVMFLISYALDLVQWREELADYAVAQDVFEAIVPAFVSQVRRSLRGGVLCGYRSEFDSLAVVRGQIRFGDQIRRWFGRHPPIEVRFDDFTEDIIENQLLKSALLRLRQLRIRSDNLRRQIREFDVLLASVTVVEFTPGRLPDVLWTRLNTHYRPAVGLAKLILNAASFEPRASGVSAPTFLVDMNDVFETFVVTAFRDALGLSEKTWSHGGRGHALLFDEEGQVSLKPDFSWWKGRDCLLVGDVKYKLLGERGPIQADLYQLLAYTLAARLPLGVLVYAAGGGDETIHTVKYVGKVLRTVSIDLSGSPDEILARIHSTADDLSKLVRDAA